MLTVCANRKDFIRESHDSADGGICINSNFSLKSNHYLDNNKRFVGFIRLYISTIFSYFACVLKSMRCSLNSMRCSLNCMRYSLNSMRCSLNSMRYSVNSMRCSLNSMRYSLNCKRYSLNCKRCSLNCKRCVRIYKQYKQIHFRLMSCLLQLYQNNISLTYRLLYDIKAYLINLRHFTERLQLNNTNHDNWFDKRRILLSNYETIALIGK